MQKNGIKLHLGIEMVQSKKLDNGFEYIEITNNSASAKIALQGAHIFDYKRNDEEPLLWLSEVSKFEYGTAIRGGIPICWPWFGLSKDETLPQHGFARSSMFELDYVKEMNANTSLVSLKLEPSKESLAIWPYQFKLNIEIIISDKLTVKLKTTNVDMKPFEISQALHTYFHVSDITNVEIKGLDSKPYLDALTWKDCVQNGNITFKEEVDRVYQEVDDKILLIDKESTIAIKNEGSSSVVVWNPWIDKCKRMSAMEDEAYKKFVCIESANAFNDSRLLDPKESHTIIAVIY